MDRQWLQAAMSLISPTSSGVRASMAMLTGSHPGWSWPKGIEVSNNLTENGTHWNYSFEDCKYNGTLNLRSYLNLDRSRCVPWVVLSRSQVPRWNRRLCECCPHRWRQLGLTWRRWAYLCSRDLLDPCLWFCQDLLCRCIKKFIISL